MTECRFCSLAAEPPIWMIDHGSGVVSLKPFGAVATGHRMFVPKKHVVGAADDPAITALCFEEAAKWAKNHLPFDFNLIVNSGEHAGQTVFHLHVHYVPRYEADGLGYRWEAKA